MSELLAPAGTLEKLKWAVNYGADAVYLGTKSFSLRNFAGNFEIAEVKTAMEYLHKKGKKGYITLNIYPWTEEYEEIIELAKQLEKYDVDAFIVSDLGVINELKRVKIKTPLHISTQANTVSFQTIRAYKDILNIKRINLARELSFERIKNIQTQIKNTKLDVETEAFIHGAVCFSFSGRCSMSEYMTKTQERSGNHGSCAQPCRWNYSVVEEKREGEYYPVFEDNRGLYIFNSKDLALFRYVQDLQKIGVKSFKIEGRMKTIHYLATVTSLYRQFLDAKNIDEKEAMALLNRVQSRGYSEGFMKGNIIADDFLFEDTNRLNKFSTFVANSITNEDLIELKQNLIKTNKQDVVLNIEKAVNNNKSILRTRNRILAGESLEVLTPNGLDSIKIENTISKIDGTELDTVHNDQYIIVSKKLPAYSIIRRVN